MLLGVDVGGTNRSDASRAGMLLGVDVGGTNRSDASRAGMLLGVDVGGTFTDAVLVDGGRLITAKAPTTPDDQSRGVLDAVRAALERAGRAAGDVEAFAHGMTVATNALLEGVGARTVLC
ncbi:MAG: N-methylhydantoinase, partial [Baekduia sp.]|nr:N-methylhydantoinase [Baekduia sp.]